MKSQYETGLVTLHMLLLMAIRNEPDIGKNLYLKVLEATGNLLPDSSASVYNALKSMVQSGLVAKNDANIYHVTDIGVQVARQQAKILVQINRAAKGLNGNGNGQESYK